MTTENQTRQLFEIEAIKQLKARYFRLLDTKQWDELRAIFTDDATFAFREDPDDTESVESVVARWSAFLTPARTVHQGHTPEIELLGDDRAHGIWAMVDYVEWPEEDGVRKGMEGHGHYHEDYAKVDGEWKIARLRLTRLRVNGLPASLAPFYWQTQPVTEE
jgi:SnoaL-like protein